MSGPFEVGPAGGEVGPGGEEVGPGEPGVAAGLAAGTGAAFSATVTISSNAAAGLAQGTGAASDATISTAGPSTSAAAGVAAGTGAAGNAAGAVAVNPGAGAGTGIARTPTAQTSRTATAGVARGTGTAYNAAIESVGVARGAGTAYNALGVPARATISVGVATGIGQAFRPTIFIGDRVQTPPGSGNPGYPWTLFRGQVVGVKISRQGELLRLTLDCEDYNRLLSLYKIGMTPFAEVNYVQPDGTLIWVDPAVLTAGVNPKGTNFVLNFNPHWFGPTLDVTTHVQALVNLEVFLPDLSTAGTDLKAFGDLYARYQGPYTRWWISTDLALWYTQLAPVGEDGRYIVITPFSLDEDSPPAGNIILPMILTADWDFASERRRLFIRGGTPETQFWVDNPDEFIPVRAGDEYHDSPGLVTAAEALAVARWQLTNNHRAMLSGQAHVESGHDGWRVGQTLYVTSERLSLVKHPLLATSTILQQFSGKLVGPGPGLSIILDQDAIVGGNDISTRVTWQSFSFGETLGGSDKATIVIEIADPDETFEVRDLADVQVLTNGQATIEYDLTYGDIQAGDLPRELEQFKAATLAAAAVKPVYHFKITVHDPLAPLYPAVSVAIGPVDVMAQLVDDADKPVALEHVYMEWLLLQWADAAQTIPASGLSLADAAGLTDITGKVFTTISAAITSNAVVYEVQGLALPIP